MWLWIIHRASTRHGRVATTYLCMFRAIGVILILWYLSHLFTSSLRSLDSALSATFKTLEAAAIASQKRIE